MCGILSWSRKTWPDAYSLHKRVPHELFELNPELRCVFVESHERRGGGRSTVRVRQLEISLPITLRNNFSSEGAWIREQKRGTFGSLKRSFKTLLIIYVRGSLYVYRH
ncbi:MAG: hypothetical protein CM15mV47_210 [uncultured marine virus]|nr:MAG: hypothetical protein CM15mV47_210 [uncultured marine virus]